MPDGLYITQEKFYQAIGELKSLMIQLDNAHRDNSQERHRRIQESIAANMDRVRDLLKEQDKKMATHEDEDAAIHERVTTIEETQKRQGWLALVIMPSMIAAWEFVRKMVFGAH